jgi:hypothetical protein
MGACYGGTDVMERSCAVARGIDINNVCWNPNRLFSLFRCALQHYRPQSVVFTGITACSTVLYTGLGVLCVARVA